jgi:hypothetical protein
MTVAALRPLTRITAYQGGCEIVFVGIAKQTPGKTKAFNGGACAETFAANERDRHVSFRIGYKAISAQRDMVQ